MTAKTERNFRFNSNTSLSERFLWQDKGTNSLSFIRWLLAVLFVAVIIFLYGKNIMEYMLQEAAETGSVFAVNGLLKLGVDINSKDEDGWTALMIAAEEGNTEVIKVLLGNGAAVNQRAMGPGRYDWFCEPVGTNQTALGIARFANHQDIVELLRSAGGVE